MLVKEQTRKLARIVTVDAIKPIPKADFLEIAVVGVWECIVKKGLHQPGSKALYFEIDAALSFNNPVLENFDKKRLKVTQDEYTNEEYVVIKSMRMRGVLSQGLLLSFNDFELSTAAHLQGLKHLSAETNVTDLLEVLKYVSPQEAKLYAKESDEDTRKLSPMRQKWNNLRMKILGNIVVDGLQPFPYGHIKSEEERIQNAHKLYQEIAQSGEDVELSIKLNGESAMFYTDLINGKVGVAQRNYSLRTEDVLYTTSEKWRVYISDWMRFAVRRLAGAKCAKPVWKKGYLAQSVPLVAYFHRMKIAEAIKEYNKKHDVCISVQGEMVGPDFHGNAERVGNNRFYAYRVYVNGGTALPPAAAQRVVDDLAMCVYIPVIDKNYKLPESPKDLLKLAEGPGFFDKTIQREGLVAKCNRTCRSFKIISNKWLEMVDTRDDFLEVIDKK